MTSAKIEKGTVGSSFDDFLREYGILDETEKIANERISYYTYSYMTPIRLATCELVKRYIEILNNEPKSEINTRLIKMCETILDNEVSMYDDKVSRWLGFIQGVMFSQYLISIEDERNISRSLFYKAYEEMGISRPKVISI